MVHGRSGSDIHAADTVKGELLFMMGWADLPSIPFL